MTLWIRTAAFVSAALALTGCSAVGLLNGLTPSWGYDTLRAAYGAHARQGIDVHRPRGEARGTKPVIVFFYGGRWQGSDRADFRFVADAFTNKGFVVMIPDYRLYPEVTFPGFVEDGAQAVKWAYDHAAEYGGDPQQLFLLGHSSGAHTAIHLASDERFLRAAGLPDGAVKGAVGLAGPYDFLPFTDDDIKALMGPAAGWPDTQPINYIDGHEPPMLLLQGDADDIVRPHNAANLAARIREKGGQVTHKVYPGVEHFKILVALAAPLRAVAPVLSDVTDWLNSRP